MLPWYFSLLVIIQILMGSPGLLWQICDFGVQPICSNCISQYLIEGLF